MIAQVIIARNKKIFILEPEIVLCRDGAMPRPYGCNELQMR